MAVVKANGYGHGAAVCAPILAEAGADLFGVATVGEAVELRSAGVQKPILVLTGASGAEVGVLLKERLAVAVIHLGMARDLAAAARGNRLRVHLKIDTGMGRLGIRPSELPAFLEELRQLGGLEVEGVFSHFGNADDVNQDYSNRQIERFQEALAAVAQAGFQPRWIHLANSAATFSRPDAHFNLIRPGLALYGLCPPGVAHLDAPRGLRPVLRLVTRILQIKDLPAGEPVSYSQTFITKRPSRIAVLPIGYADGYSRALSNRGYVLIGSQRAPVVGNVCMDLTMVDVTDVPEADVGTEVILFGGQGDRSIPIDEVALWENTISYEVMNRIGKRVPRLVDLG